MTKPKPTKHEDDVRRGLRTAQYNGIIDTQLKVIDELKAEVERLRKAGDNLERVLTDRSGSYEAGNASHEWQSAKNYKQS